jgi:hypothetical protein
MPREFPAPAVLDAPNLVAKIHNKRNNTSLRRRIEELEKRLKTSPRSARRPWEA